MNISLTDELEQLVKEKLDSGMYHSASEVVRDGLRLLKREDEIHQKRLEQLNHDIMLGLEDSKAGRTVDADTVYKRLKARGSARKAKA